MIPRRALPLLLLCLCACTQTTNLVGSARGSGEAGADSVSRDAGDDGSAADAASRDAGPSGDAAIVPSRDDAGVMRCGKAACACSNGADDDGDALDDSRDPECIGPGDDDERSFATGAERGRIGACQDCFFDANAGAGNDGCRRATSCAVSGDASGGSGSCRSCDVGQACIDHCRPLTPNGCDCFGCCAVHLPDGRQLDLLLTPGCSMSTLEDSSLCTRCIRTAACENPCDTCELCLGKGPEDLPAPCQASSADPNAPRHRCSDGEPVCDAAHACPAGMYCQWGCCLPIPF